MSKDKVFESEICLKKGFRIHDLWKYIVFGSKIACLKQIIFRSDICQNKKFLDLVKFNLYDIHVHTGLQVFVGFSENKFINRRNLSADFPSAFSTQYKHFSD